MNELNYDQFVEYIRSASITEVSVFIANNNQIVVVQFLIRLMLEEPSLCDKVKESHVDKLKSSAGLALFEKKYLNNKVLCELIIKAHPINAEQRKIYEPYFIEARDTLINLGPSYSEQNASLMYNYIPSKSAFFGYSDTEKYRNFIRFLVSQCALFELNIISEPNAYIIDEETFKRIFMILSLRVGFEEAFCKLITKINQYSPDMVRSYFSLFANKSDSTSFVEAMGKIVIPNNFSIKNYLSKDPSRGLMIHYLVVHMRSVTLTRNQWVINNVIEWGRENGCEP